MSQAWLYELTFLSRMITACYEVDIFLVTCWTSSKSVKMKLCTRVTYLQHFVLRYSRNIFKTFYTEELVGILAE